MPTHEVVIIGAGVGGLAAAAMELRRRGFEVVVLERNDHLGGKASERFEAGFRWDEGPSIVVMPWVYRTLFDGCGLDPDRYLPMTRLDPAFRVTLSDGRALNVPADEEGLRAAFTAIDPADGDGLTRFLAKVDRFAALIGHAYCDRMLETWPQVMLSPLMLSAAVISPNQTYPDEIAKHFRSSTVRELLMGFPTFSGFDPAKAPASLAIIPWTIIREGVWYPERGGVAAIPRALADGCRDMGVEVRTGVEVEAIELGSDGRVTGVATSSGVFPTRVVVSNADYVHTHCLLRGGRGFPNEVDRLRAGDAQPSSSFFTIQLACERTWPDLAHHLIVLTEGSGRVYDELYQRGSYPTDPSIYVNTTSVTVPGDAPPACSNPFVVVGAPAMASEDEYGDEAFERRYAGQILERLESAGLEGLRDSCRSKRITGPAQWRDRFHAFRGAIHGLGPAHNVLAGSFRPLNYRAEIPGLYFVGGGVQPGPGLPMVVQSGKITAERVARDVPRPRNPSPRPAIRS